MLYPKISNFVGNMNFYERPTQYDSNCRLNNKVVEFVSSREQDTEMEQMNAWSFELWGK